MDDALRIRFDILERIRRAELSVAGLRWWLRQGIVGWAAVDDETLGTRFVRIILGDGEEVREAAAERFVAAEVDDVAEEEQIVQLRVGARQLIVAG